MSFTLFLTRLLPGKLLIHRTFFRMTSAVSQVLLEDLCKRRFFFTPSFSIYGGVAGLYDLGPPGCALKANMETLWRQHFIIYDSMSEISCTCLTPEQVLKTSGHVDRFTDLMVRNEKNPDEVFRADKLIGEECKTRLATGEFDSVVTREQVIIWERDVDTYSAEKCDEVLSKLGTKAKHNLCFPFPFNLMFQTSIGPQGNKIGYLRPETAQGMFVNFKRLLEQNGGKMPFAAAQIGLGFRNEIAPRQQLLRVREFPMAEIEHFVHPQKKNNHPKFKATKISELLLPLYSKERQEAGEDPITDMTLGAAVSAGIVNNETLAYFIGRVYLYLTKVGLDPSRIRFRQHRSNEMAHYASDCWDAEAETSYGWIEIVGIADRAAYDLTVHSKASKVDLVAHDKFEPPIEKDVVEITMDKAKLGKLFKKELAGIVDQIEKMSDCDKLELEKSLADSGVCSVGPHTLTRDMISFAKVRKTIYEDVYTPSVIEPAFGMGRVLFCILEHSFKCRDEMGSLNANGSVANGGGLARCYLALPPLVAPIKVSVLPISSGADEGITTIIDSLSSEIAETGLSFKVDDSGQAIGRRYARTDEIGIPFGITVDFESVKDRSVTLRERDSMEQVRIPIEKVVRVTQDLANGRMKWDEVREVFPRFGGVVDE
jgi:glycyl-tRNA synthetase